jgi:anthranilate phosphoribosyltransferase
MTASASWPVLLEQLLQGHDLPAEQAGELMHGWLEGRIEPVLTGALLAALRAKGLNGE